MKDQPLSLSKQDQSLATTTLPTSERLTIKKIDSLKDLKALESVWKELIPIHEPSSLGICYDLICAIMETFADMQDPDFGCNPHWLILLVYQDDKPAAIAPLVKVIRKRKFGPFTLPVSCIEFIPQLTERFFRFGNDIVAPQAAPALTNKIIEWLYENEQFDIIHLAQVPEQSKHFYLPEAKKLVASLYPVVDVSSYSDYQSYRQYIYSKNLKQSLRTANNRAERYFAQVSVQIEKATSKTIELIIPVAALKIDANTFIEGGYYSFILNICQRLPAEIVLASIGSEIVGYHIYVHFNDCKYLLDGFINRDYSRLELGARLTDFSIQRSFEQKVIAHSEGNWDSFHARKFASSSTKMIKYALAGNSLIGPLGPSAVELNNKFILGVQLE